MPQLDMFRKKLENMLNHGHELYQLARLIDWEVFEQEFGKLYSEDGRPGSPIRLMVGLTYLGHAFGLSDEEVVTRWVENPYWQFLCGEEYFRHDLPIDPSSMSRWRKRIGEAGAQFILKQTLPAGLKSEAVRSSSFERVSVDTTVQPKAIAFPTDSKLYNRSRERLVRLAEEHDVPLRQSYSRLGPEALIKAGRYFHARQSKRARREVRRVRGYLGRVYRDILRKIEDRQEIKAIFLPELALAEQLLGQGKSDKNKLYSLHAPEAECIAKGKAHKKYEFGVKVSVATTNRDNFVVGMLAEHGNPYDGHTLSRAIEQVKQITGKAVNRCFVDRGYRGHGLTDTEVLVSGRRRGLTPQMKKELKRRSAIEPVIGHMKADGKLGRNYLRGELGDKINAILCGAGYNIRIILRKLREIFAFFEFMALIRKLRQLMVWRCYAKTLPFTT